MMIIYIVHPIESYEPELYLKAKLTHESRNKIAIGVDYGENANSAPHGYPEDSEYYLSLKYHGGVHPLLGDDNDNPLLIDLDYNYYFENEDVGKIFLVIHERESAYGYEGQMMEFELVDKRWGETFELESDFCNVEINEGYNWFFIDYDLIPHENPIASNLILSSNMVSRFSPTVTNNATLTIDDNIILDMYNSELTIEEGCSLIIGDNVVIHAMRGISKINVYGNVQIGSNVTFSADEGSTLELYFDSNQTNITDCHFQNCIINSRGLLSMTLSDFSYSFLNQSISDIDISHSKFNHSSIMASNPTIGSLLVDNIANITDCYFHTAYNEAHSMIELYGYKEFNILTDTIDNVSNPSNTCHGISIHYSGSVEPNSEHMIADNLIYCSFGGCSNDLAGITAYSSIADIQNNYIYLNQIGIQSLNYSRLYITGNSSANSEDQTQRIINNGLFQLFASRNAFPLEFHYNSVYGDASDCFIFHDVDMSLQPPNVNVSNNYWGPVFDPDVNLCPERHYDYEPIWQLQGGQLNISAAQQLFLTGVNQISDSNYTQAKATFQQVVAQFPDEEPAKNSFKEILFLEPLAGNDFEGLKTWYLTDSVIVNNEILTKFAESLANKCDEKLEHYPEAIDWYESVIENPETLEDSIFAIIDLEHLYWQMGIDTNLRSAYYVGRLSQFKPESFEAFRDHKDELLSLLHLTHSQNSNQLEDQPIKAFLPDKNSLWNAPNPFKGKTQIFYSLKMESDIQLKIFNNVGQMVYSITEMNEPKGEFKFEFDATDLDSGIYYYQINVNGIPLKAQKMIVL